MHSAATNFNRLLKVLKREGEPDRVPFYEHFADDEVVEAVTGKPMTKMLASEKPNIKAYMETLVEFYVKLGYDYVPFEIGLKLPRTNVLQAKDIAYLSRGVRVWPDEQRGTIESLDDFEKYPWPDPYEAMDLSYFETLKKVLPDNMGVVGGASGGVFEHVSWLMGLANLCKAVYLDKKLVEKMFNRVGSLILAVDEEIVKGGYVGALRMGDDLGYKTATFVPPKLLRRFAFPWYRSCVELAHKNGLPFVLHSCGNIYMPDETGRSVMDDLVEDVGIDAKHSYEDAIMPACKVKEKYGDKVAVLGGVDIDKLARLSESELRRYVRDTINRCALGGGYALGSGNSIANYIPVQNYLAMLDEGLKFGRYPIV
jgi:uroporphyrinogen decarboxylase